MENVARIIETEDGSHSLFSEQFDVGYHSKYGAIQESEHVFIQAGLVPAMAVKSSVRILEMGFGSGLNAYLSLLFAKEQQKAIFFESIEAFPIPAEQAATLNYPTLLRGSAEDFLALHQAPWNEPAVITPRFTLHKIAGTIQDMPLSGGVDVVFFDAFFFVLIFFLFFCFFLEIFTNLFFFFLVFFFALLFFYKAFNKFNY